MPICRALLTQLPSETVSDAFLSWFGLYKIIPTFEFVPLTTKIMCKFILGLMCTLEIEREQDKWLLDVRLFTLNIERVV